MKVVLTGYVLGIAMDKMGTKTLDEEPADLPASDDTVGQRAYKDNLIDAVMELAWHPPNLKQVLMTIVYPSLNFIPISFVLYL